MAEHEPGHRRIRFGEELHRRQRVEQKMRLDLRLHQLQLGLGCLLGEQIAIGFTSQYLRLCARLAELEQEQHADEKTGAEGVAERRHERVGQRGYLDQAISLDAETISLDQYYKRHSHC